MKQQNTTYAVIVIVSVIIGFMLGVWWQGPARTTNSSNTATTTATSSVKNVVIGTSTESLSVPNQLAGSKVVVDAVRVNAVSWVVITEDLGGRPARILGAYKVLTTDTKTEVDLLRNTVPGSTYHAVLYRDDGDSAFDYKVDAPITTTNGGTIEVIFKTS